MPWKPAFPGERPSLGPAAVDWMIQNLAAPDRLDYEPFYPTLEQFEFLNHYYALDPFTGKRVVKRGVLSRARGWGKSPFLSAIALFEALGDAVPDGWNADGRPVGKPWWTERKPWVAVAAATEDQTANAWQPLLEMLSEEAPVIENYWGIEPMQTRVNLPYGLIEPVSFSGTSIKGARWTFAICDQTEQWLPGNGAHQFFRIVRSNLTKTGGALIESPNAYIPGLNSVAERTAAAYQAQREGRARASTGLYYDHREAPADTSLTDRASLEWGLRYAYGCSANHPAGCALHGPSCPPGWADMNDRIMDIWADDTDEQDARADFLNQITFASDSWLSAPEWNARRIGLVGGDPLIDRRDAVVLGFDGSRGRVKGMPDATALVGCRVRDGHLFMVDLWEADAGRKDRWADWEPPLAEIEARIDRAFKEWNVVGMYCDPARDWRSYVNQWEARYASRIKVKASVKHPMEWWMLGGRATLVEQAVEQLESAIRLGDMTHDGDDRLTRHMLNARRRLSHGKLAIDKESSYSINKIDAAVAGVLAWQARNDAVAAGFGKTTKAEPIKVLRKGQW